MAKPGIVPDGRMRRKPLTRNISMRSAVHHISGQEQPYPILRFSDRIYVERPNHNPFKTSDPPGFTLIFDDFNRTLMDDEPETEWRDIQLASYDLPILTAGTADITSVVILAAAIRDDVNSNDHFVELELNWAQTADFYASVWCWVRARSDAANGGDSGYYGVVGAGDNGNGDAIQLTIARWDAPDTYVFPVDEEFVGSKVIPVGSLLRTTADGRDITCTLDLGGTGENDFTITHRVPADDPYLQQTCVGFGNDGYAIGECPLESVKIGLP